MILVENDRKRFVQIDVYKHVKAKKPSILPFFKIIPFFRQIGFPIFFQSSVFLAGPVFTSVFLFQISQKKT